MKGFAPHVGVPIVMDHRERAATDPSLLMVLPLPPVNVFSGAILPLRPHVHVELACKRAIDIFISIVALILVAPLAIVIAIVIRVTSEGPAIFRQQRIGRNGDVFTMLKFRTMRDDTQTLIHNDPALWDIYVAHDYKLPNGHQQITRVGFVLRKLSLDEIPQFINVLRGDMGAVGVRPIEPAQFASRPVSSQHAYCRLRPGLTGLWQVEGRSSVACVDRVALDDRYVTTWTIGSDVKLLARTPLSVLRVNRTC